MSQPVNIAALVLAFLNARLAEDEKRARQMGHLTVYEQPYYSCPASRTAEEAGDLDRGEENCDCFLAERKARALQEVAAKRSIIKHYLDTDSAVQAAAVTGRPQRFAECARDAYFVAVLDLFGIYSNHPDYGQIYELTK